MAEGRRGSYFSNVHETHTTTPETDVSRAVKKMETRSKIRMEKNESKKQK